MQGQTTIRFGNSVLDLVTGEIVRGAETVRLGKRSLRVMHALLDARGHVVSNEDLLLRVWPGMVVEANTVQVHISLLRKALGPDRSCLRTLSGCGYRLQLPAEAKSFAAEPTEPAEGHRSNLRSQLDPLIGRDEDLGAVRNALSENRLVSIVGSGGVGKTRLALEIGWHLHDHFSDGAWLIDFATVRDPELAVIAAASALGIPIYGESHTLGELVVALSTSQRLLIFDNCEYQSRAIARLVEALLRGAPEVSVLVTSQEPLGIQGEHLFPLAPLPAPSASHTNGKQFAAVTLFVQRAQAKDPSFVLNSTNAPFVAEICRRLDGVPLAIEMAVGRLPLLGLKALADGLDDRLQLLRATSPDAEMRHATLLAMVEWSIGLLNSKEEEFFFRLGIFPSSFSLDAAVAIAGAGDVSRWDAFDLLGQLVNKSLLVMVQDDPPRYRLLETLRLFALNRLSQRSEYDNTAESLSLWLIEYFANAHVVWECVSDKEWYRLYAVEADNVRAALTWGFGERQRASLTAKLASATARIWRSSAWRREGHAYLARALNATEQTPHGLARAELLVQQADFLKIDSPAKALENIQKSSAICRDRGDRINLGRMLSLQAYLASRMGDIASATELLTEAESILVQHDTPKSLANLFSNRAMVAAYQLRFDESRGYFTRGLNEVRRFGDEDREAAALTNLAEVEYQDHEVDVAISLVRDALRKLDPLAEPVARCNALNNLAGYLLASNRDDEAAIALEEALLLCKVESGMPNTYILNALVRCALLGAHTQNSGSAATLIGYLDLFFDGHGELVHEIHERATFDTALTSIRIGLSEDELVRCRRRGALYSVEDSVNLAQEQIVSIVLASHESRLHLHSRPAVSDLRSGVAPD